MPESTGASGRGGHPVPSLAHPRHGPGPLVAIAVGGALGTLARYGVERTFVAASDGFPWATFSVNVVGSFVLGIVVMSALVLACNRLIWHPLYRLAERRYRLD